MFRLTAGIEPGVTSCAPLTLKFRYPLIEVRVFRDAAFRNSMLLAFLIPMALFGGVFLMPLFLLMRWLGLVNTHGSLILTYLTFGLPLSIWLLKGFYDNIPIQLEQAARIDGATRFQAFILIVMPLSTPGIIADRGRAPVLGTFPHLDGEPSHDALADAAEAHLDLARLWEEAGGPPP